MKSLVAYLSERQKLAPFQRRFVRGAFRQGIDKAVLSAPRGNGKSSLSGELLAAALDPAGPLFVKGGESVLLAGSLDQARAVFRFLRARCDGDDFRYLDSGQRVAATHVPTHTRVRVASSDSKRAFGIVGARLVVGDEPGSWQERGGALMYDALETTGGKNAMTLILIGTRAPGPAGGWWRRLVDGDPEPGMFRLVLDANDDEKRWHRWTNIRKANPLIAFNPNLRPKLDRERAKALKSEEDRRRFCTYRLNRPQQDGATVVLTVDAYRRTEARDVPDREGRPIVGVDLGSNRAWSSAVAMWLNGRVEAIAVCPGIPDVETQEKRDSVEPGTYQRLIDGGRLMVAGGVRVPPPSILMAFITSQWQPRHVVSDDHRSNELRDVLPSGVRLVVQPKGWKHSSEDVRALRRMAEDGPAAVDPSSRSLLRASLSVAVVKHDEFGNMRMVKGGTHNKARDDVAAAWLLAAGVVYRQRTRKRKKAAAVAVPSA